MTRLLDRGFHVAGIDVGESYGSPTGRAAYEAMHRVMTNEYGLSAKACLLPQSRGGLMLYNWAAEHPEHVQCIGGIYPVCDLASYPGFNKAAGAYGMTPDQLRERVAEHSPIDRLAPLAAAKVPILHLHGDSDLVVPLELNSGELVRRYKALGGPGELEVVPGKGHMEVNEFFESPRLLDFFIACAISAPPERADLDAIVKDAVRATCEQFANENVKDDEIAVTVIDLRDPNAPRFGSHRGDRPMFPASVVKLFYLAYAQQQLEDGKLADSEELRRGMRDMIVDSSNDATGFILDAATDAPNGDVLPPGEMEQWAHKRNAANRYFAALGYGGGINVNQKAYCEGPYGRERVFIGPKFENRNKLTTDATAKLMMEVALRRAVTPGRSEEMMQLLARDRSAKSKGADDQAHGFIAGALPAGAKVWSKAGWTSTARHDAAYVESPDDGVRAVIVIFTTGHGRQRQIVPALGKRLFGSLAGERAAAATQPVMK